MFIALVFHSSVMGGGPDDGPGPRPPRKPRSKVESFCNFFWNACMAWIVCTETYNALHRWHSNDTWFSRYPPLADACAKTSAREKEGIAATYSLLNAQHICTDPFMASSRAVRAWAFAACARVTVAQLDSLLLICSSELNETQTGEFKKTRKELYEGAENYAAALEQGRAITCTPEGILVPDYTDRGLPTNPSS